MGPTLLYFCIQLFVKSDILRKINFRKHNFPVLFVFHWEVCACLQVNPGQLLGRQHIKWKYTLKWGMKLKYKYTLKCEYWTLKINSGLVKLLILSPTIMIGDYCLEGNYNDNDNNNS